MSQGMLGLPVLRAEQIIGFKGHLAIQDVARIREVFL
jgi:hypothetical protein